MTLHNTSGSDVKISSNVSKINCDVTFHSNISSNVQMSREDAKIVAR